MSNKSDVRRAGASVPAGVVMEEGGVGGLLPAAVGDVGTVGDVGDVVRACPRCNLPSTAANRGSRMTARGERKRYCTCTACGWIFQTITKSDGVEQVV